MAADGPREGGRDGRGNLSQRALIAFCSFFLETAIDQVRFMRNVLDPAQLLLRMELHIEEEVRAKRFPKGSFAVLREAVVAGEIKRGNVAFLTGQGERAARMVTSALVDRQMLVAKTHRAPLRLAFPANATERWLPLLYPADVAVGGDG